MPYRIFVVGKHFVNVVQQEVTKPGVPPPTQYVGVWVSQDGQHLTIRADGHGDYHGVMSGGGGSVNVDGGKVDVSSAASTLHVGMFGIGRTFHIDKPPRKGAAGMEMTLDGTLFRQSFGAPANPNAPSTFSYEGKTK